MITVTAKPASENVLPWIVNHAIPADRLGEISFMDPLLFDHFVHAILAVPADGIMLAKFLGFYQSILNTKSTSQISHNITTYHQHVFPALFGCFTLRRKICDHHPCHTGSRVTWSCSQGSCRSRRHSPGKCVTSWKRSQSWRLGTIGRGSQNWESWCMESSMVKC